MSSFLMIVYVKKNNLIIEKFKKLLGICETWKLIDDSSFFGFHENIIYLFTYFINYITINSILKFHYPNFMMQL